MTAPTDSSVTTKILSIDHTVLFFSSLFYFIIDNCKYGSLLRNCQKMLLRKCQKMKTFLLFTIIYSKININVVKTILRWQ